MKIAQVVCTFPPYLGGIGNSAFNFAKFFSDKNIEIITFTPKYEKKINSSEKIIRLSPWIKYGNGALIPQILWKLKKYDAIYLHYPFFGGAEIVWLYKIFNKKKKLIVHYHMDVKGLNFFAKFLSLPSKLILKSLLKQTDYITCASFDYIEKSQISETYLKHKKKFKEIPFGVDINRFFPAKDKKNNKTELLFVGGLDRAHYFKGVDILLKAASKISHNNWRLQIVGNGNLLPQYKNLAEKLKIKERVNFLENIGDEKLPEIYAGADIFILPSINQNEAFGIVLLEAMASGLALIASDLAGVRKVFENQKQGLLVEPKNVEDLKKKIEYLSKNKSEADLMGKRGRKLAEEKYSWSRIKEKFDKILINLESL